MSAVRLIFEIEGDRVTLLSAQDVDMIVPPGDERDPSSQEHGFWAEVQDEADDVLYRLGVRNPLRREAEVFTGEADGRPHWQQVARTSGAFTIVVPTSPEADHVALVESEYPASDEQDGRTARRVIGTFSLRPEGTSR